MNIQKQHLNDAFSTNVTVQFHEVDSMKIVHHSYYIYWMEKARFDFAKSMLGFTFNDFEKHGILLPVTKLEVKYLRSAVLGQEINVHIKLIKRNIALATFIYEMRDRETGAKLFEGLTEHAFVDSTGKLLLQFPVEWMQAVEVVCGEFPSYIGEESI